jgi:hypothetical protein
VDENLLIPLVYPSLQAATKKPRPTNTKDVLGNIQCVRELDHHIAVFFLISLPQQAGSAKESNGRWTAFSTLPLSVSYSTLFD